MPIRPGQRLIQGLLGWALLSMAPLVARAWLPELTTPALLAWAGLGLAGALWALDDLRRLARRPDPGVQRRLPPALAVGAWHPVTLTLTREADAGAETWLVADHHPPDDIHSGLPRSVALPAGQAVTVNYRYRPSQRGPAHFGDVEVWLPSPRGLWEQRRRLPCDRTVPVYPDFSPIARAALAVDKSHQRQGARVQPRRGEGLEFNELRDYQPGDSPRRIDWKATARRRKLISRHYQDEQNQTLWILLDGGRRMALPVGELSAFDHGLNAALLLSWSALRLGDRVGAMLFSGDTPRWLPPVTGGGGVQSLVRGLYDVHPADRASDFSQAARAFQSRWTRRALVVLVTRLQPEDDDDLLTAVNLLSRRHRVLVADLELPEQQALARQPVTDLDSALSVAADAGEQQRRRALHTRLRRAGAHLVAATPDTLAEQLGRAYHHTRQTL